MLPLHGHVGDHARVFYGRRVYIGCKDSHEEQLQKLENAPSKFLRDYYSKIFGVNQTSILQDVPFLDVCQQFPQDIMHVFLKWIRAYELKYLLRCINEKSFFRLSDLNKEIQPFSYGYSQVIDKPCNIKQQTLIGKAPVTLGKVQPTCGCWLKNGLLF